MLAWLCILASWPSSLRAECPVTATGVCTPGVEETIVEDIIEGVVERIGFRSTVVRKFDKSVAVIPNFQFAENAVINVSETTNWRISWIITLQYDTTVDQLKKIRDEIYALVLNDTSFAKNEHSSFFVRIDSFSDSSIDMLVQAFTVTNDWGEYLKIKENLAVKIIEIVDINSTGFAFPSQSLYVESLPSEKPEIFNPKKELK